MPIKILIAEDHEIYRDGLRTLIETVVSDDSKIFEACDYGETLSALANHPDIALLSLDIHMPGVQGLEGLASIKNQYPLLPIVVVSTVDHQASIQQMVQFGADAFIAKTCSRQTMTQAFIDFIQGKPVIISGESHHSQAVSLSPRQVNILERMAKGLSNKEIATELDISAATARDYVSEILKLFDSNNRTKAVIKALQLGFIFT